MSKEKIAKLLRMAEHEASNPHEAAMAAAMAAKMAAEEGITFDEVRKGKFVQERGQVIAQFEDQEASALIASGIAPLFGCRALLIIGEDGESIVAFRGRKENVERSHYWYEYLWSFCLRKCREHAMVERRENARDRKIARHNFRLAYAATLRKRLDERLDEMRRVDGVTGQALIVAKWFDNEVREVTEWAKGSVGKNDQVMDTSVSIAATVAALAGMRAATEVGLSDQVVGGDVEKIG